MAAVLLAALLAAVLVLPLASGAFPQSHDLLCHFYNGLEYAYSLQHGVVVAHLTPNFYAGLGAPLFKYYPPYSYLPVSALYLAGFTYGEAFAVGVGLAFFLCTVGTFLLARLFYRPLPALAAAVLITLAPYHLHDYYRRFAYPELWGFALFPWALWALARALRRRAGPAWIPAAAALAAAVGLVHPLSGLLLALVGPVFGAVIARRGRDLLRLVCVFGLAAGLGAFYALPAALETDQVLMGRQFRSAFPYHPFALTPAQLLGFTYRSPWRPPLFGWPLLAAAAAGAVWLLRRRHPARLPLFLGVACLLLATRAGTWVADLFPPIRYLQFPYRFLLPATLFLSVAGAACARRRRSFLCVAALGAAGAYVTLHEPGPWRLLPPLEDYARRIRRSFWVGDYQAKYTPVWAADAPRKGYFAKPRPVWRVEGAAGAAVAEEGPERLAVRVRDPEPAWRVVLGKLYVPGWRAEGGRVEVDRETGLLAVAGTKAVPALTVRYRGTRVYRLGRWVSWAALFVSAGFLAAAIRVRRKKGGA